MKRWVGELCYWAGFGIGAVIIALLLYGLLIVPLAILLKATEVVSAAL